MKIEPLGKYSPRDYALLTPGNRTLYVETKYGKQLYSGKRDVENALRRLAAGFTCYVAAGLQRLRNTTGASEWVLSTWRGRDVKMTHIPTGVTVTSLQSNLIDEEDAFGALSETLEWIKGYGIAPSSIASMAWKLLRASISSTVTLGFDPEVSERAFFGGRQEIWKPDTYNHCKSVDIKAAYPSAMASAPIALSLRSVDVSTTLDPDMPGLVEANVFVPLELPYAPLPVRVTKDAIQFQYHEISGVWTWRELAAAIARGVEVEVIRCWAPRRTFDLFGPWWQIAQEGRSLPNGGDKLAKAIANSTWGQFSMRGEERGEVHWADDKGNEPFSVDLPSRRLPHIYGVHVAAEITSRVRVQTLDGMYSAGGLVVHVDTDGIIMTSEGSLPDNAGEAFGQWRTKEYMNQLEVRAPQMYRYTKPDEPYRWHYVASGQTHDQAVETFTRHPDTMTRISYLSPVDRCLAPGSSRNVEGIANQLAELKRVAV